VTQLNQTSPRKSSHSRSSSRTLRAALLFQRGAIALQEAAHASPNPADNQRLLQLSETAAAAAEHVGELAHILRRRQAA